MVTKKEIENVLKNIPDPELGISLVDLGLIYGVTVNKNGNVHILMTLTSMGCPLFSLIETPIKEKIGKMKGISSVDVELTFDPPWSIDKISNEAKEELGFI